ncbi:DUF2231 domain-containing protein [Nocardia sp. NPDC057455]|uniref:DUF2231 domain-containing protein n=1 Tax=Nocardia sp. NPDC057455 TaxID=3346138 RepID=UPI00366D08A3
MSGGPQQGKQPVSVAPAGPYAHPLHPILVTVPIGASVAGVVFDLASNVAANPAFSAEGARWLIAIGVPGALAAATVGFPVSVVGGHGVFADETVVSMLPTALGVGRS